MIHWPEKFKWIEGKKSKIKYLQGLIRGTAVFMENILIRISPLPKNGVNKDQTRDERIIVSLTSYPGRIRQVYYSIKSLMGQSLKPDRIILWLSEEQFPDRRLPSDFEKLKKRGLEIYFTEDDLKSHKKYYYALRAQRPDEIIVTYDDDLIYESKSLEKLVTLHKKSPEYIIVNRGEKLGYDPKNGYGYIEDWGKMLDEEGFISPSHSIIPSTGAGCLYPYGKLKSDIFNKEMIRAKVLSADDIWIWHNALKSGVKILKTQKQSRVLCPVWGSQKENLSEINVGLGENKRIIKDLS